MISGRKVGKVVSYMGRRTKGWSSSAKEASEQVGDVGTRAAPTMSKEKSSFVGGS